MRKYGAVPSALFVLLTPLLTGYSHAQGPHSLEVGLHSFHYDYVEEIPSPLRSTERGWVPGLHAGYRYRGVSNPLYLHAVFEYSEGETDFDGTTQGGIPLRTTTENTFVRFEGTAGYTFTPVQNTRAPHITIYTGLGYFFWERGLGGFVPFDEEYSWKYVPVGFRGGFRIGNKWTGAVDASMRFTFDGRITIQIPGSNNPVAGLGNKPGWKIAAPLSYQMNPRLSLVLTPWYEHSEIGMSNVVPLIIAGGAPILVFEPPSKTDQFGIRAGLTLHF